MATKTFNARVQNKRDTSANWTKNDPVLLDGEIIIVDTTAGEVRYKVGDGSKKFSQLPFTDEAIISSIPTKTSDLTNDSGFITSDGAPVQSVNGKTGTISLSASDVGAAPAASGVPSGAIMMWSGASTEIPSGWVLCNGSNNTPDLRNRFVIGAGSTYAVGATGGGSSTTAVGDVVAGPQATVSTSALPPYYALCYIMKT